MLERFCVVAVWGLLLHFSEEFFERWLLLLLKIFQRQQKRPRKMIIGLVIGDGTVD
jgi:hypothetical protein